MSEIPGFNPDLIEEEVQPTHPESRFGNKELIREAMDGGNVVVRGRIEDFHDVAPHRNVVELAYVRHETVATRNESELVDVEVNGLRFEAVFKPVDGEDKKFHNENGLGHDYSREVASYFVSEHFGFDLVPPTVARKIGGQTGSLQYFLPEGEYATAHKCMHTLSSEDEDSFMESEDLYALSVLDWITANADRHADNYMLKVDENKKVKTEDGRPEIIAIDNGAAFNDIFYRLKGNRKDIPGPYQFLTTDNLTGNSRQVPIPTELMARIKAGYENKDQLEQQLLAIEDLDPKEVALMWQRVEALMTAGVFLSGPNYKEVTSYPQPV